VGPLAAFAEPHTYDLCEQHARGLTAPRGWDLVRHDGEFDPPPPTSDDLVALAEAVREAGRPTMPAVREGRPVRASALSAAVIARSVALTAR
jgi:hypothetical protein